MKIEDKPTSMAVKDYLYKTLALKLNIPSQTIDKVITHSFESTAKAMRSTHKTVEITGFGKFIFSLKKAIKKLEGSYEAKKALQNKLLQPVSEKEASLLTRKLNVTN